MVEDRAWFFRVPGRACRARVLLVTNYDAREVTRRLVNPLIIDFQVVVDVDLGSSLRMDVKTKRDKRGLITSTEYL